MRADRITSKEFWDGFDGYLQSHAPALRVEKRFSNYVYFPEISRGYRLCVAYSGRSSRMIKVELLLHKSVPQEDVDAFVVQKRDIERDIGAELCWKTYLGSDRKVQLIKPVAHPLEGDPTEHYAWYVDTLELFQSVFEPRIRRVTGG